MSYASRVRGADSAPSSASRVLGGLAGQVATVELDNGRQYQGVLLDKSTPATYVLGQVQLVSASNGGARNTNPFEKERSFDAAHVACVIVQRDLREREETTTFRTDTEISASTAGSGARQLQKWTDGDAHEGTDVCLDAEAKQRPDSRGWNQFEVNRQLFGYESSYVEEHYTTKVDRNSQFYKRHEERAQRVAKEIMSQSAGNNAHVAEERGHTVGGDADEEARFSTVLGGDDRPNVYRPPAARSKPPALSKSPPRSKSPARSKSPPANEATTPVTDDTASTAKPKLNANAKTFTMSAAAKEFVPSGAGMPPMPVNMSGAPYGPPQMAYAPMVPPYPMPAFYGPMPVPYGQPPPVFYPVPDFGRGAGYPYPPPYRQGPHAPRSGPPRRHAAPPPPANRPPP